MKTFISLVFLIGIVFTSFHKHSSDNHTEYNNINSNSKFLQQKQEYNNNNEENQKLSQNSENEYLQMNIDQNQCTTPNVVPTLDKNLGVSLNIISFSEKRQIFEFTCNQNKLNLNGRTRIPDGIEFKPLYMMDYRKMVKEADTVNDFEKLKLETLYTEVDFSNDFPETMNEIIGEKDQDIMDIKAEIDSKGNKFLQISTSYKLNEFSISDYDNIVISQELLRDLIGLPDEYDERMYSQFIDKWGTHYREKIILGGRIQQVGYTPPSCPLDKSELAQNFEEYFTTELQGMSFSESHLEDAYENQTIDAQFTDYMDVKILDVLGGQFVNNDLSQWVESVSQYPVVVEQRLASILSLFQKMQTNPKLLPDTVPPAIRQKVTKKLGNFDKPFKQRESIRKGCQIESAINFDRDAILADNDSCYYTIFFGSYQIASGGQCSASDIKQFTLINPATGGLSCQQGTQSEKIAIYYYGGCTFEQHFCLRIDVKHFAPDLKQSLEICKREIISNNFYEDDDQYFCTNNEKKLYANFKEHDNIYTCQQSFCQETRVSGKEQQGILDFYYKHDGTCTGVKADHIDPYEACKGKCLYQYGTFHVQKDCILHQFMCLRKQYNNIECVNYQKPTPPPPPPPVKPKPEPVIPPRRVIPPPPQKRTPEPEPKPYVPKPIPHVEPPKPRPHPEEKSSGGSDEIIIIILISLFCILIFVIIIWYKDSQEDGDLA